MKLKKTGNLSSVTRTKSTLLWSIIAVLFFSFSEHGVAAEMGGAEVADIQQQRAVSGRIVDQTGEPVIGATIIEVGTTNGTITNLDGEYTLHLTTAAPALNISFIGFEEITVNVGNQSVLNLVMQEYTAFLDELVVIGYGTARRGDLTGAISTIRVDETMLAQAPRSVQDLLRANAPGLHIGLATNAQGNAGLMVRGDNSFAANSEPLVVLDGVIFQGSLSDLNPSDIASINVLKDASSAAVFGSRAAGGVVAIVTQRGARGGRPRINVTSNVGIVTPGPHRSTLMSPDEFINFRTAFLSRDTSGPGWDGPFLQSNPQHFSDPRNLQGGLSQLDWINQGRPADDLFTSVTEEDLMRIWGSRLRLGTLDIDNFVHGRTTDWESLVFQTGFQQEHNISVSNRTDDMSIFWSMGYTNREGLVVGDVFERFTTRLNLEATITPFLRAGMHTGFVSRNAGNITVPWGNIVDLNPFAGNYIGDESIPEMLWRFPAQNAPHAVNPLYDRNHISRRHWHNRIDANMFAVVSLPFNIEYQINFTPNFQFEERFNHEHTTSIQWETGMNNVSTREHWKRFFWQVDNIVRWNETFGIHRFDVTLLANAERRQTWRTLARGQQFEPNDMLGFHNIGLATRQEVTSTDTYATGDALMARLAYNLLDRYSFTATVRRDGFSAFGMNHPRGTFASFAGAWTFTSEPFAQSFNHIMDFGRLRASWGENGNRDIGIYAALAGINWGVAPVQYVDANGNWHFQPAARIGSMANHDLRWERTAATNIGLDFGFIGRIRGSLEFYDSQTSDLLMWRRLPTITGFSTVMANLGRVQNRGFEASLTYDVLRNQNFAWTTSGSFSLNRRTILSLFGDLDEHGNEVDVPGNNWWIGRDPSVIWMWENDGVWQLHEAEIAARWGRQPGDFRYLPADGRIPQDGSVYTLTDEDRIFMGYRDPRFRWTWSNNFTLYRNWNVSMMMYSLWGHYGRFNRAAMSGNGPMFHTAWSQPFWTPNNPINDFAAPGSDNSGSGANIYRNRSFIRLDNITISYNVPREIVQRISVQNMRLSASVRNVAVWAPHWTGWDPETFGFGIDAGPGTFNPRTFNFNVNFTL